MKTKTIKYQNETYTARCLIDKCKHTLRIIISDASGLVLWEQPYNIFFQYDPYQIHLSSLVMYTFNEYLTYKAWIDHQEEDLNEWNGIAVDSNECTADIDLALSRGELTGAQINDFTKEVLESNGSDNEDSNNKR